MSEPIPESIPTSQDPRSRRPTKKRALTPNSAQASSVEALFAHPEREVIIPLSATREAVPKRLPPPPEIVANVQGSSAGAGSGEFHVYKASRRREYERLRLMDEEMKKEKATEEFERNQERLHQLDEAKTNKNKARREKAKARKRNKARAGSSDLDVDVVATAPTVFAPVHGKHGKNGNGQVKGEPPQHPSPEEAMAVIEEDGVTIHDDG